VTPAARSLCPHHGCPSASTLAFINEGIARNRRVAASLVAAGVKELLIISQDTSAYGVDLKYAASDWKGREVRARFLDPAGALGESRALGAVALRLSLPARGRGHCFQHAAPSVLRRMKRQEKTVERIARWREICPDLTIRSTFIRDAGLRSTTSVICSSIGGPTLCKAGMWNSRLRLQQQDFRGYPVCGSLSLRQADCVGADAPHVKSARVHHAARRRGGGVAGRGARAAASADRQNRAP